MKSIYVANPSAICSPITSRTAELVDLNSQRAIKCKVAISEALLLGKSVTFRVDGPALFLVGLVRWLGVTTIEAFLEENAIRFAHAVGSVGYHEGSVKFVTGVGARWEDPEESVVTALKTQLQMSNRKARQLGKKVAARAQPHQLQALYEANKSILMEQAATILMIRPEALSGLPEGDPLVRIVVDLIGKAMDYEVALDSNALVTEDVPVFADLSGKGESSRKYEGSPLRTLLSLENLPSLEKQVNSPEIAIRIREVRADRRAEEFWGWLSGLHGADSEHVGREYLKLIRCVPSWQASPTKALHLLAGMVLSHVMGPAGELSLVVAEKSWIQPWLDARNPATFVTDHFARKSGE